MADFGISTMLTIASMAMSAIGSFVQAKAQADMAEFEAAQARQRAEDARLQGELDKADAARDFASKIAASRANIASRGGDLGDVTSSSLGILDNIQARYEDEKRRIAIATSININNALNSAAGSEFTARSARFSGALGAADAVLAGATTLAKKKKPAVLPQINSGGMGSGSFGGNSMV